MEDVKKFHDVDLMDAIEWKTGFIAGVLQLLELAEDSEEIKMRTDSQISYVILKAQSELEIAQECMNELCERFRVY